MATWYFSDSLGNDAWSGTLPDPNETETDGPKQTLSAARNILNDTAAPGDSVCLRRGDTWIGNLRIDRANGSSGSPITLGDYGSGNLPKIELNTNGGEPLSLSGFGASNTISWVTIQNLHLTTSGSAPNRPERGIMIWDNLGTYPSNITLSGLLIDNCRQGMGCFAQTLTIDNCTIRNNSKDSAFESGNSQGIYGVGDDFTISNCLLENNGELTSQFDHQLYLDHVEGTNVIEDNEIVGGPDGIKIRSCHNVTIQNNIIRGIDAHGIQIGGCNDTEAPDATGAPNHYSNNIIVDGNRIHTLSTSIVFQRQAGTTSSNASTDIVVRNNLCYGYVAGSLGDFPGNFFVSTNDTYDNLDVYNNVFWGPANTGMVDYEGTTNLSNSIFKNNIIYTNTAGVPLLRASSHALSTIDFDRNVYYRTDGGDLIEEISGSSYTTLTAFKVDYPSQEANGLEEDPVLVDPDNADFKIASATAPVIDAGEVIGTGLADFDGISRPDSGSWDIGAYEYVGFIPPAAQLVISAGVPIFFEGQGTSVSLSPDAGQLMLDGVVNYTNTTDYTTTSTIDVPPGSDFVLVKNKRDGGTIDRLGGFTPLNIKPEK